MNFLKEDCLLSECHVNPDLKLHVLNAAVLSFLHIFSFSLLFLEHATDTKAIYCSCHGAAKERKIICKMGVLCSDLVLIFPQWPSNEDARQNIMQRYGFHS